MIEGEAVGRDQQGLSESKKSPKCLKKKEWRAGYVCQHAGDLEFEYPASQKPAAYL